MENGSIIVELTGVVYHKEGKYCVPILVRDDRP